MISRYAIIPAIVLSLSAFAIAAAPASAPAAKSPLAALINALPDIPPNTTYKGPQWPAMQKVVDEVLKGGAPAVAEVADMLVEPGKESDFKPRYTLDAIAAYVGGEGREAQRKIFVEGLSTALAKERPGEIQKVLLVLLQFAGDSSCCPAVGKFLGAEEEVSAVAALALSQIGGESAAEQLRTALPQMKAARTRANIIRALGVVRDAKSEPMLIAHLTDAERDVRIAAAYALADIGLVTSCSAMLKATEVDSPMERGEMHDAAFLLAKRLVQTGRKADGAGLYLVIYRGREDVNFKAVAIDGLARCGDASADEALTAALQSNDARIRNVAVGSLAAGAPGDALDKWYKLMATDEAKALFIRTLATRSDGAGQAVVLNGLKESGQTVRDAAAIAAGNLGSAETVPALIEILKNAQGKGQAVRAVIEQMRGAKVSEAVATALPAAGADLKAELIGILAARRAKEHVQTIAPLVASDDAAVRLAAIKAIGAMGDGSHVAGLLERLAKAEGAEQAAIETALAAIGRRAGGGAVEAIAKLAGTAPSAAKPSLLRVLGQIGSPAGLDAVRAGLKDAEATVAEAALKALTSWPNDAPAADLLAIAGSGTETQQVLALRAYAKMVQNSTRPADERLKMVQDGLAAAKRDEEKKLMISALGSVPKPTALELALTFLDTPMVEEAGAAAVSVGRSIRQSDGPAVREAMAKVIEKCKTTKTVEDAKGLRR